MDGVLVVPLHHPPHQKEVSRAAAQRHHSSRAHTAGAEKILRAKKSLAYLRPEERKGNLPNSLGK